MLWVTFVTQPNSHVPQVVVPLAIVPMDKLAATTRVLFLVTTTGIVIASVIRKKSVIQMPIHAAVCSVWWIAIARNVMVAQPLLFDPNVTPPPKPVVASKIQIAHALPMPPVECVTPQPNNAWLAPKTLIVCAAISVETTKPALWVVGPILIVLPLLCNWCAIPQRTPACPVSKIQIVKRVFVIETIVV